MIHGKDTSAPRGRRTQQRQEGVSDHLRQLKAIRGYSFQIYQYFHNF